MTVVVFASVGWANAAVAPSDQKFKKGETAPIGRRSRVGATYSTGANPTMGPASVTPDDSDQYQQALSVAHIFSQRAKRRMNRNLRAMLRNEDESAKSLADYIFDKENYPWDVL